MYPIPPNEHLVENRTCRQCATLFPITDRDMEFYEKVSPSYGGKRYIIPPPTLCPDCREQRRESWQNETKVYKNNCVKTGKEIFSMYRPGTPYTVVNSEYWWSDTWDGLDFYQEWNPKSSFTQQVGNLMRHVPRSGNKLVLCENCNYCDNLRSSKDCYYAFNGGAGNQFFESSYYTVATGAATRHVMDTLWVLGSENCYELTHCEDAYKSFSCENSTKIDNCNYCRECHGCSYCSVCEGLSNQKYHFMNKRYSKEDYEKKVQEFQQQPPNIQKQIWANFSHQIPKKSKKHTLTENVYGDYLTASKNAQYCFCATQIEDSKYMFVAYDGKSSMDCTNYGVKGEHCYETLNVWHAYNVNLSITCTESCQDLYYCDDCTSCNFCFGCVGLKNKSYCILNKQYTKEEYERLVPRIIERMRADGEWGEFFPSSMSPFGYNETVANEYYPLTKSEAVGSGRWNWSDYEAPFPKVEKVIPASRLPDSIDSIPDDILNWAIECEVTGKPFRIIKQELEFYRKHSIPIPHRHPDQRHRDRMKMRNPRKLLERTCDKCQCDMITTYAPERTEIVYCDRCYEREVMG